MRPRYDALKTRLYQLNAESKKIAGRHPSRGTRRALAMAGSQSFGDLPRKSLGRRMR